MVFLELGRDSRVTTGNSGFLFNWPREVQFSFELRVRTGDCSRDTAGPNRPHLGLCPGPNVPLLRRKQSQHCILDSPGSQASSRGEAKDTALLSSRDGYILELTVWPKMPPLHPQLFAFRSHEALQCLQGTRPPAIHPAASNHEFISLSL